MAKRIVRETGEFGKLPLAERLARLEELKRKVAEKNRGEVQPTTAVADENELVSAAEVVELRKMWG